ncbi:FtsH protease activity modulator HflK [Methylococcus sp. ANG]|uniref:FtsH protease activity modulator HflK n=1 Tax=unclassified Methylococcus TaxID=2618889 RepID=UPI001C5298AE|nr:FtsH protease activity modulator HflK [Methylococcus sp. Mc7]QXP84249.1 FtsH protease activity modulator HflK [Methylococcus sp. Mc7]
MAWNEPGGGKKDPWSGRDQQDTPPDLDEVLRNLQDRINKLFGRRPDGGGGGGNAARLAGMIGAAAVAVWGLTGIYIVDEGSRGVVTRFGKYVETTQPGPHWHWPSPVEAVTVVNVEQQRFVEVGYRSGGRQQAVGSLGSVPREALMLTKDENIVDVRLAVQYQIKDAKEYLFNVLDPEGTLKQVTESAERSVIGNSTMDFVLTEGRSGVAADIKAEIQEMLDQYRAGIRVITVNLVDAQPPEEVQASFEDAIKAREDEQRLKNEAEAYANEVVPKARGAASRLIQESDGYKEKVIARARGEAGRFERLLAEYEKAPDVMRERLYIESMQEVVGRANTLLLDVKSGNNVVYLPLDKIRSGRGAADTAASETEAGSVSIPAQMDSQDGGAKTGGGRASSRGRDGRGQ